MMMVITGPSGNVGAELVDLLVRHPPDGRWRVASRHPHELPTRLADASVEVVALDFFDRSTWEVALTGVRTLFLLFPLPSNRAARQAIVPFLSVAERLGCRHVVYVSVFGADRARLIPHYTVETALRASSMRSTVLRCGFFMQNLHRTLSTHGVDITERGELFIPAGAGRTHLPGRR